MGLIVPIQITAGNKAILIGFFFGSIFPTAGSHGVAFYLRVFGRRFYLRLLRRDPLLKVLNHVDFHASITVVALRFTFLQSHLGLK